MSDDREQRNAVFQPPAVSPGIQTVSVADKVKAEFGLDIPNEIAPLPSCGKVYPTSSALCNRETIEIRSMTTREEDILMSRALLKKGTVITELIKSCVVDKSINVTEMLTGDRTALMVAIRITGYGPEYDAEIVCGECENKFSNPFDLSQLPLKRLEIEPKEQHTNQFEFLLPYSKKRVTFKFLTGLDEEEIAASAAKQKKLQLGGETAISSNLLHSIISIDGISDRSKIANFVRMMPARDSRALREFMRDNEPGITMRQEVTCPSCGHTDEVSMPMGVSFLWPGAGR